MAFESRTDGSIKIYVATELNLAPTRARDQVFVRGDEVELAMVDDRTRDLFGGVVYDHFDFESQGSCFLNVVTERQWTTNRIQVVFGNPFVNFGIMRLYALIENDDDVTLGFADGLGFTREQRNYLTSINPFTGDRVTYQLWSLSNGDLDIGTGQPPGEPAFGGPE